MPKFKCSFAHILTTAITLSICANAYSETKDGEKKTDTPVSITESHIQQQYKVSLKGGSSAAGSPPIKTAAFKREAGLTGVQNYIIRFKDAPVAQYKGGVNGIPP
ncbi:MAG: hypothetical protein ABW044_04700, partial [Cellvibrio sp.]